MSPKRFLLLSFSLATLILVSCLTFAVVVDPFNITHDLHSSRYFTPEERFSKSAIARSPIYDSFIVGTSLSRPFPLSRLNQIFNARFANLSLAGSTSYEQRRVLEYLSRDHYRTLVLEVYISSYTAGDCDTRLGQFPEYMWDVPRFNDLQAYLMLNRFLFRVLSAAFSHNVLKIVNTGAPERLLLDGTLLQDRTWSITAVRASMRKVLTRRSLKSDLLAPTYSVTNLRAMLDEAVVKFDRIILYFPPITAAFQKYYVASKKRLRDYLDWRDEVLSLSTEYENVVLIDYQTVNPVTVQIANFWDASHYRKHVSDMICDDLAALQAQGRIPDDGFGFAPPESRERIQELLEDFDNSYFND